MNSLHNAHHFWAGTLLWRAVSRLASRLSGTCNPVIWSSFIVRRFMSAVVRGV